MVCAVRIVDQLEAIAAVAGWLEVGGWGPAVRASVDNLLGNSVEWQDVLRRAFQEYDRDSASGRWLPSDGVLRASWDDLIQAGLSDRVAAISALSSLLDRKYL